MNDSGDGSAQGRRKRKRTEAVRSVRDRAREALQARSKSDRFGNGTTPAHRKPSMRRFSEYQTHRLPSPLILSSYPHNCSTYLTHSFHLPLRPLAHTRPPCDLSQPPTVQTSHSRSAPITPSCRPFLALLLLLQLSLLSSSRSLMTPFSPYNTTPLTSLGPTAIFA